ncbi:PIN domain-containing protein [Agromyces sp. NPDC058484]|uniref:type II toxin-antitoxin system VapC family toxin n=1 Tax=Agromyces sp. NPDC058484 TaxID=3346524 RepID=UPI00364B9F34
MTLLVDTSVWSLAFRRDAPPDSPEVAELRRALAGDDIVVTTGLILQELVQGFVPEQARTQIIERFTHVPLIQPDRDDHIAAAGLRNACRRAGVQLGTIDALLAQLCIRHRHSLLTTDRDFMHAEPHIGIRLWKA